MTTLDQALRRFLLEDRAALTNRQYNYVLTRLITTLDPASPVHHVTYDDLMDYLASLKRHGLQESTITGYTTVLKTFFNWCVQRRYVDHSPAAGIKRRRARRTGSRAIPPGELTRLVDYASRTSPRNYAMLLFCSDTGCRVGGLASLTRTNINLVSMSAVILEKGGNWQTVYYGDTTAAALAAWLDQRPPAAHDYAWTGQGPHYNPLTISGIAAMLHRLSDKVEASRPWFPHAIRHSLGHAYARAGIPVTITQRKLGHSSASITLDYYYPDDDTYLIQVSRTNALITLDAEIDKN